MSQPLTFKPELLLKIYGEIGDLYPKRMTRRWVDESDSFTRMSGIINEVATTYAKVWRNRRKLWETGDLVGFKPGRTAKLVARAKILDIRKEKLGMITKRDVISEGFLGYSAFVAYWEKLYGSFEREREVYIITFDTPVWTITYEDIIAMERKNA